MCSAAHEVNAIEILEAVSRAKVQHLPECMCEIERRTAIDSVAILPVGRRYDLLEADTAFDAVQAELLKLLQDSCSELRSLLLPVDVLVAMRYRCKHVERALSLGCECWIGDAGVLHIDRGIVG